MTLTIRHPHINKSPNQRICERGLEIDALLKMEGTRVVTTDNATSIFFPTKDANRRFYEWVMGVFGT